MSRAFNLIRESNKVAYIPCRPPRQFPDTLKLQKIAKEVHGEASDFLRRIKKSSPDRFSSVEEVEKCLNELRMHEAYFQLEWARYSSELDADEDYQTFRRKYFAVHPDKADEKEH